jgi:hypothetical protein
MIPHRALASQSRAPCARLRWAKNLAVWAELWLALLMVLSRVLAPLFGIAIVALASGCLSTPTGAARVQEAAGDFNLHSRFGRTEVASMQVVPEARETFAKHRAAWGTAVRIADLEMTGLSMTNKEQTEAAVTLRVAWFRPAEGELHVTAVKQQWKDQSGEWKLAGEERIDGEIGLLGENVQKVTEHENRPRAQFPTQRLSGSVQAAPTEE